MHDLTRGVGEDRDGDVDDAAAPEQGRAGELGLERVGFGGEVVREAVQAGGSVAQSANALTIAGGHARNRSGISTP